MIHSLTYRMTGSLADAEDLAQETFINAYANRFLSGHFEILHLALSYCDQRLFDLAPPGNASGRGDGQLDRDKRRATGNRRRRGVGKRMERAHA